MVRRAQKQQLQKADEQGSVKYCTPTAFCATQASAGIPWPLAPHSFKLPQPASGLRTVVVHTVVSCLWPTPPEPPSPVLYPSPMPLPFAQRV